MKKNLSSFGAPIERSAMKQISGGGQSNAVASCAGAMCGGFAGALCEGGCVCKWVPFGDYGYCRG